MRGNAERRTYKEPTSSHEVWNKIRYLDPDVQQVQARSQFKESNRLGIVAVLFAAILLCVIALALYLRGI
jgi:hypothetical protein